LKAHDINIPGDISSAAYFITAAAILPGSEISMTGVGLNPLRSGIMEILRYGGAEVSGGEVKEVCNETVGTVRVTGGMSNSRAPGTLRLSGAVIPGIIDELPILAVFGTRLDGGLEVRDAGDSGRRKPTGSRALSKTCGASVPMSMSLTTGLELADRS
jgi:3-phosphoshikimate 1-carboxyvinyltransferase